MIVSSQMDTVLYDELLQEIFHRLPPPSSAAVSLVSRRFLRLLRSSTTSLSLHLPPPYDSTTVAAFSSFLNHHPFLSSLYISAAACGGGDKPILISVASSCPNLRHLRFLSSPVSTPSLSALSASCARLSSIAITISRPLSFDWIPYFKSLKSLSLNFENPNSPEPQNAAFHADLNLELELELESLSLCGVLPGDHRLSFLWQTCRKIEKLRLKNCQSVGDYSSFSEFLNSSSGSLRELELRTCRSIVDIVLLTLSESSVSVDSLLIYDGGSNEGLLRFMNRSKCRLKKLDLRLPLDLDNSHLIALSRNSNFRDLVSLRLQSCCLVSGEGLKAVGEALGGRGLEELALVSCDLVDREPGLLTAVGQSFKGLKRLNLSYNDTLVDKELICMLASCCDLVELKLRGCRMLTDVAMWSIVRCCKKVERVDMSCCRRVGMDGVEFFVTNCRNLRRVEVEESKVSEAARAWGSYKFIEFVS